MANENWKPVNGFEGRYEVSDLGRVRSRIVSPEGRLLRPVHQRRYGHAVVVLSDARRVRHQRSVHRLVLEAFTGPAPAGTEGSHLNGDPTDNRSANLAWETRRQNMQRRGEHGRTAVGEHNGQSILTTERVREMRTLRGQGWTQVALAAHFQISRRNVRAVLAGRTWRHIESPSAPKRRKDGVS